jgi:hypothetical protein
MANRQNSIVRGWSLSSARTPQRGVPTTCGETFGECNRKSSLMSRN